MLDTTLKRRFGTAARAATDVAAASDLAPHDASPSPERVPAATDAGLPSAPGPRDASPETSPERPAPASVGQSPHTPPTPSAATPQPSAQPSRSRHLPHHVRRVVFARDEARCTWRGPDGVRCNSRAWLEHDHITPRGHGGDNDPSNIRLLCRAHNRLEAEDAYGRDTIARIIEERRHSRDRPDSAREAPP